jgi:hypothetical protein
MQRYVILPLMGYFALPTSAALFVALVAIDELQSTCGVSQAISFQVAVQTAEEWTSNMSVCYWTEFCLPRHDAANEASSTLASCIAEPSGTFELDLSECSSVQVHAAVVRRDSDGDKPMSEITKVALSPSCTSSDLPLCTGDAHIQGAWVPFQPTAKAFICCGWDKDDYLNLPQHCGTPSIKRGFKDSSGDGASAEPPYFSHVGGRGCVCDAEQGRLTINRRERYTWAPHYCTLTDWDAHNFCAKLGARNMIFIGDSTTQQAAVTVINMLVAGNGTCAEQVQFKLCDTLTGKNYGVWERGGHWVDHLQSLDVTDNSIIVLSTGPHIHYGFQTLLQEVVESAKLLHIQKPNLTIVWKTQQPGHRNCSHAFEPLTAIQQVTRESTSFPILSAWYTMHS